MAAPTFPVNTHRYDPYRTFMFQVVINGETVAGLSKMGKLSKKTEVSKWRSAGDPSYQRVMPGGTSFEPVTLEQGLTHHDIFERLANRVNNVRDGNAGMSLKDYRTDVIINVKNLQGVTAMSYKLLRAWVSEFHALPDFDANNLNTVGIQSVTFQHEGFIRDTEVSEPAES